MGMENMSNGRLSLRQCRRTLFLELFGVSVFLMTGTLVRYSGKDCFQYLVAGIIPVLLLALFYGLLSRKQEIPYGEQMKQVYPRLAPLLAIIYLLRMLLRGGFLLAIFYQVLKEFLLEDMGFTYLMIPFLVVCFYGVSKGREKRHRGIEFLFWFVIVPFVLAMLLVVKDVDISQLARSNDEGIRDTAIFGIQEKAMTVLLPLALYSNVEFLLFLLPVIGTGRKPVASCLVPILLSLLCNFLLLFLSVGILGYGQCRELDFPALRVLQSAKVPGGFLERLDILIVAFWMFAIFSVVSGLIFHSGQLLCDTCSLFKKSNIRYEYIIAVVILYCMGMKCHESSDAITNFLAYSLLIDIPLGIVLAAFVMLSKKVKKKLGAALAAFVLLFSLCGCSQMVDVEDQDYVLSLGIDASEEGYVYSFGLATNKEAKVESLTADNLKDARKQYEKTHDRALQMGHLSAILLGSSVYEEEEIMAQVLEEFRSESRVPVTTRLYGVKPDAKKAMKEVPDENKTLGEYIDQIVENQKDELSKQVLLKLYYQKQNSPVLTVTVKDKEIKEIGFFEQRK